MKFLLYISISRNEKKKKKKKRNSPPFKKANNPGAKILIDIMPKETSPRSTFSKRKNSAWPNLGNN